MNRNKQLGTSYERRIADYLAEKLNDDRIDRAPLRGTADRGDISGVRSPFGKVAVEVKRVERMALAQWVEEAAVEKGNADAAAAVVVHWRRSKPTGRQYVTLTLDDLIVLLGGDPNA